MDPNHPQSPRYRPTFYDILPTTTVLAPELSPFPGSLRLEDVQPGEHLAVTHAGWDGAIPYGQMIGLTVTDRPAQDPAGEWLVEVVFDRHTATNHPDLPAGQYKPCCYQEIKLADIGVVPYLDQHWSQDKYTVGYREAEG